MAHPELTELLRLCECGCLTLLQKEPRFIKGHNSKTENRGKAICPDDPRGPNPSGLCMCGCGASVPITSDNHKGRVFGCYVRFLKGHDKITVKRIGGTGLCFCGCGMLTPIARQSRLGNIAGQPQMYCPGHRQRVAYIVNPITGCWELPARHDGYSRIRRNGRLYVGHVWFWEQRFIRTIPQGFELDHLCRNRCCVNTEHLELITHAENMRRIYAQSVIPIWRGWNSIELTVDSKTGCWNFPVLQTDGYGRIWMKENLLMAHRLFFERDHGPIPKGLELDHLCGNRGCVFDAHLEPVTHLENTRRARARAAALLVIT